jgi:hypothetical protein
MGSSPNITGTTFPRQGKLLGRRAKVLFRYGRPAYLGEIVRDDMEEPFQTIIKLDDGRVVLGTECQYSPLPPT